MVDLNVALLKVVRVSKNWSNMDTFEDVLLITSDGKISLNGVFLNQISFSQGHHDKNHYLEVVLAEMSMSLYDFLVTEPGYTDRFYITTQDDSIDIDDLVDGVNRALIINLYETFELDNPHDEEWIYRSFEESQGRKRKYGAMQDRMLFVNDEEKLLLPGLNFGFVADFDDMERDLSQLILHIGSESLEIDFFQAEESGLLRIIDEDRPRYFPRDSSLSGNVYQILSVDLPLILGELGYSPEEIDIVSAAKNLIRSSLSHTIEGFEYKSSSTNVSLGVAPDLAELALRLRFSPETMESLSSKIIGIEAHEVSNVFGPGTSKIVIRKIPNSSGYWDYSQFSNSQIQEQSEPIYCGDWISALYRHVSGSNLTFNVKQIAEDFGYQESVYFDTLDLTSVNRDFASNVLESVYKVSLITKEFNI